MWEPIIRSTRFASRSVFDVVSPILNIPPRQRSFVRGRSRFVLSGEGEHCTPEHHEVRLSLESVAFRARGWLAHRFPAAPAPALDNAHGRLRRAFRGMGSGVHWSHPGFGLILSVYGCPGEFLASDALARGVAEAGALPKSSRAFVGRSARPGRVRDPSPHNHLRPIPTQPLETRPYTGKVASDAGRTPQGPFMKLVAGGKRAAYLPLLAKAARNEAPRLHPG